MAGQEDGQASRIPAATVLTSFFSAFSAVSVCFRFVVVGRNDSSSACWPITARSAAIFPASALYTDCAVLFSTTSAISIVIRSAGTWLRILAFTAIWLTSVNAARSAVIFAQETEGLTAGILGALVDGPADPVELALHAANNVVATKAAIASSHRRLAVYCSLTVAV